MKLISLDLINFRQFYGQQHIDFAPGSTDGRNITVFHGFNGAGKTTLLNAFVWCLYGEFTPDFGHPDRLVNELAFAEAPIGDEVQCRVALQFEYRGETYRAERTADVSKAGASATVGSKVTFQLLRTTLSGETEPAARDEAARQNRIEQILPRSLYRFFFFNGERVEGLAKEDAYENVEAGVKTLLDIEVYERGADHLRGVVTSALAGDAKKAGDEKLAEAMETLEKKHLEQGRLREDSAQRGENVQALQKEILDLENRQEQVRESSVLANRRKQLKDEEAELRGKINAESKALAAVISKSGYLAFGAAALDITESQVEAARKRGDLPAKIKPQFVDDLLASRVCICQRPIALESPEEIALTAYRSTTGLAELEERIGFVSADVRTLRDRRHEMYHASDEAVGRLTSLRAKLRTCQEDISAINQQISDGDTGDEAAKLQELIRARNEEIVRARATILHNNDKIGEIDELIADLRARIKGLEAQSVKAAQAKKQLDAVLKVADALTKIRDIQKEDARISLDRQVHEIWNDAAIKDYEASVSAKYQLLLTKNVGGQRQQVLGTSTGEKQVLALSFVGAMVRKARENVDRKLGGSEGGGHFPLVMDSPFGSLEEEYQEKVAIWVPKLAPQVVVMASKSQWRNVEAAMRPRIGREYILELHTTKKGADVDIQLDGQSYPFVVTETDEIEKTIIRKVR